MSKAEEALKELKRKIETHRKYCAHWARKQPCPQCHEKMLKKMEKL